MMLNALTTGKIKMETAGIALQQAAAQSNAGISMIKKTAQNEKAVADMITQNAPAPQSGRGKNLDVIV